MVVEEDEEGNVVVGLARWWIKGEDTKSSSKDALHILHGMVCHVRPISDFCSAVVWGFYVIRLATRALELTGLVHSNELANSSE